MAYHHVLLVVLVHCISILHSFTHLKCALNCMVMGYDALKRLVMCFDALHCLMMCF